MGHAPSTACSVGPCVQPAVPARVVTGGRPGGHEDSPAQGGDQKGVWNRCHSDSASELEDCDLDSP